MRHKWVGASIPRVEAKGKVTGKCRYADDIAFSGLLYGATVRSHLPHGKIRNIAFQEGIPWDEFVIVTAKDIPGDNCVALIAMDQPFLAETEVRHPEEAIVLLAHSDKYLLEEARRHVVVEIEPLPAEKNNLLKSYTMTKGDVDSVWSQAFKIIEGEYATEAQEQLYIETQGVTAVANAAEGVTIWGSLQCPYYVHKALASLFGLPKEKIRVIQTETGGGFGGKEDYPSLIAGHAALLSWKAGKPVRIIYDRAEDMAATTKRHPSRTRIKTAVDAQGKFLAHDIEFTIDGGAYVTLTPVVLSRGTIHASGPYFCPNIRICSKAYASHTPPHGAFRGFGAPQSLFAIERHLHRVAKAMQMSPEEIRRRNFLKDGQTTATGQVLRDNVDLQALLDRALTVSDYHAKQKKFGKENQGSSVKRGMGLASFMHGAGFTGSGEVALASRVCVEATPEGGIRVLTSCTEIGQGKNTIFGQIAADVLGIEVERIDVVMPDTAKVPDSGPTVASRTSMVVGDLVGRASAQIRQQLIDAGFLKEGYGEPDFVKACKKFISCRGPLRGEAQYEAPPGLFWDDAKYQGDAYGTFAWAVYVAQVRVDTVTCEIAVEDFWAVQEVGRVLNPVLASGQIEGGVAQGVGYALYEKVIWKEGRMINNQMTNYIIPTSADVPNIHVYFEEVPYRQGFTGAKGIGELPMDGPAPAILNAVEEATGITGLHHIPLLPEDLMRAMETS